MALVKCKRIDHTALQPCGSKWAHSSAELVQPLEGGCESGTGFPVDLQVMILASYGPFIVVTVLFSGLGEGQGACVCCVPTRRVPSALCTDHMQHLRIPSTGEHIVQPWKLGFKEVKLFVQGCTARAQQSWKPECHLAPACAEAIGMTEELG